MNACRFRRFDCKWFNYDFEIYRRAVGLLLGQYHVPPYEGRLWDGIASITIGVVLAIVAFYLARSSRGLLLGEAATAKNCEKILQAVKSHPNVVDVV